MCRIISRIVLKAFVLLLFDFNAEAVDLKSIPYFEKAEAAEGGVFLLKVSIISEPRLYTLEELGIPYGESLVLNSKILLFKNIAYIPPGGGGYAYFSSRNKWVLHAVHYHDEIKSKVQEIYSSICLCGETASERSCKCLMGWNRLSVHDIQDKVVVAFGGGFADTKRLKYDSLVKRLTVNLHLSETDKKTKVEFPYRYHPCDGQVGCFSGLFCFEYVLFEDDQGRQSTKKKGVFKEYFEDDVKSSCGLAGEVVDRSDKVEDPKPKVTFRNYSAPSKGRLS